MVLENMFDPNGPQEFKPEVAPEDIERERDLEARFDPDRMATLCEDYFENGVPGINLKEHINGRNFVVAYIPAGGPYGDIGRAVEYPVFAKAFKQSLTEVDRDYGKYDAGSVFACVIDVSGEKPVPAGALRAIHYVEGLGFKDMNDLVEDDPDNPWIDEIKTKYFADGEPYDPMVAWQRLGARVGVDLKPEESLDIATHASAKEYAGKHGDINGVSMLFYHACLRYALATGHKNLLAIFDIKPFENLQQFGSPFDTYADLEDHPYGGPYDTRPAFCLIERALERIGATDVAGVFINGDLLDQQALMPNEYLPDTYSNAAVGLENPVPEEAPATSAA